MTGPLDRSVDRRAFLARTAALGALGAAGSVALPAVTAATPSAGATTADVEPRPEALTDPAELTVAEAATLIRRGRLRPETLVEAYLDRIAAHDGTYQAFNLVRAERALAEARAAGTRGRGALAGIPLAIKDNYFTEGTLTTANSLLLRDFVPPYDATSVARLTAAGAIVLGKTQMGPLATTRATTPDGRVTTVNAWAPTRPEVNPGGSSTGTATAVAARLAASGTGTQTGGSITAPSNAQNLTGLKPTMGRVSLYGIVPLTYTRDHPGPLARDALDAAILLRAMAGPDSHDPRTQGLPGVPDLVRAATPVRQRGRVRLRWPTRIGVIPGYAQGGSESAAARAAFLDTLAGIPGATVVDVPLPAEWELLTGSAFNNVRLPERSEPFLPQLRTDLRGFGVSVLGWLQGALLGADEYVLGQRAKLLLLERVLGDLFARCDVVVQTGPVPFDILGLPELALPIGFSADGLPLGTILGGLPFGEDRLLSVAAAYQAVTGWHLRRPADPAPRRAAALARTAPAAHRLDAVEAAETTQ
ncbi:amidase [Prauserella muralis]|uniref:amidase n=1 Tax=Prauserella muralis TaxID=588067 RepID=UPI0011ADFED9|nr:amidase [Prauserella muralis]TWE28256.1 amidase/aspartyl-tRNA(Asn)/glutamyl-tRNA(Gln) amidotransferase subunit A [Prauserella muralis]